MRPSTTSQTSMHSWDMNKWSSPSRPSSRQGAALGPLPPTRVITNGKAHELRAVLLRSEGWLNESLHRSASQRRAGLRTPASFPSAHDRPEDAANLFPPVRVMQQAVLVLVFRTSDGVAVCHVIGNAGTGGCVTKHAHRSVHRRGAKRG